MAKMRRIDKGLSLREAVKRAGQMGCFVNKPKRNGGEYMISHPSQPKIVRLNARKKHAPRVLIAFMRRLEEVDNA